MLHPTTCPLVFPRLAGHHVSLGQKADFSYSPSLAGAVCRSWLPVLPTQQDEEGNKVFLSSHLSGKAALGWEKQSAADHVYALCEWACKYFLICSIYFMKWNCVVFGSVGWTCCCLMLLFLQSDMHIELLFKGVQETKMSLLHSWYLQLLLFFPLHLVQINQLKCTDVQLKLKKNPWLQLFWSHIVEI